MGSKQKRKAREKQVKKRLAQERHLAQMAKGRPPSPARRALVTYDTPETLVRCGPLLKASWSVPPALEAQLVKDGRPIPAPVVGLMLIDTGATKTCMALDVAQELGLKAIRIEKSYGVHGLHDSEVFHARLEVGFSGDDSLTSIKGDLDVKGVQDLGSFMAQLNLQRRDSFPNRLIGLLGREWLRHGTLLYEGSKGRFEFKLDLASLPQRPPDSN